MHHLSFARTFLSILAVLSLSSLCHAQIPYLEKVGSKTCLMVQGKPYVMLSGELHNSTASSISYMEQEKTFENLRKLGLNTVIATVSWEQFEPVEGQFDFTLTDYLLSEARKNDLHLVLLWFGTFKNPFMTYAPAGSRRILRNTPGWWIKAGKNWRCSPFLTAISFKRKHEPMRHS